MLPDNLLTTAGGTMEGPLYLYGEPRGDNEAVTKHYVDTAAAGGLKGDKGDPGETPKIEVTKTGRVTNITFETTGQAVGALLVDGQDGKDGDDGISPTINVSKTGKITTLTITDAKGVKTVNIVDGEDGKDGTGTGSSVGGSSVAVDTTLTVSGAAADAKTTGEKFTQVGQDITAGVSAAKTYADDQIKANLDKTLAVEGKAADAYAVGIRFAELDNVLGDIAAILADINGEAAGLEEIAENLTEIDGEEATT